MAVARDRCPGLGALSKRDAAVRRIARAWRELTGGGRDRDLERRTLIACSGGGDSSGLVIALAAAVSRPADVLVVGHIVHDMRSRVEAEADRDATRELAERVGLLFVEAAVGVKAIGGNTEAVGRQQRYAALERLAVEEGCGWVAVAHQAEDQLETMLMAMVRGAGPRGLAGIPTSRRLGRIRLIRPALGVGRDEMRRLCTAAGWAWREDATNADEARLRAAVRGRVIPELVRLRPRAAQRASRSALLIRGADNEVRRRALALIRTEANPDCRWAWSRAELRRQSEVVLGELVRMCAKRLRGEHGQDRLSAASVGRVASAIRDRSTEPRVFVLGGVRVDVTSRTVKMSEQQS